MNRFQVSGPRPQGEKPRILIADDEQSMREWMRLLFQRDGFDVLIAEDGVAARECARTLESHHRRKHLARQRKVVGAGDGVAVVFVEGAVNFIGSAFGDNRRLCAGAFALFGAAVGWALIVAATMLDAYLL